MPKPPSLIFKILAVTSCILALLVLCIPTALSTNWGKNFLESQLSKRTDSRVEFDKVSFHWMGPQRLSGIRLLQESENFELKGEEITVETPFWNLLFHDTLPNELLVKNLSATISPPALSPMGFRDLKATTKLSEENTLEATISGNTVTKEQSGPFHLELSVKSLTPEAYNLILKKPDKFFRSLSPTNLSAHAEIHDFPVPILDALYELVTSEAQDVFTSILGNTLTLNVDYPSKNTPQSYTIDLKSPLAMLQADGEIDAHQTVTMHGKLKTSALNCPNFNLLIDQGIISLTQPAEIDVTLPSIIASQKTPPSRWKLERVVLPFFSSSASDEGFVELSGSSLEPFIFNLPEFNDALTVASWQILLVGDPKGKLNYQAKILGHSESNRLISNVLGRDLEIASSGAIQLGNRFFRLLDGKLHAQSQFGSLSALADWDGKKQDLFIKDTLGVDLSFDSPFVKGLLAEYGRFDPQAKLNIRIDPLHIDLSKGKLVEEHYTGSLHVNQVNLTTLSHDSIIRFKNINVPFEIDGKADVARIQWSASTQLNGQEKGKSEGRIFLQRWREGNSINLSKTLIGVEGRVSKFPLLIPNLVPLLGPIVDAQIHINWDPDHPKKDTLEIVASGPDWKSSGCFQYQKGILTLADGLGERPNLKLDLTNEKIKALSEIAGIEIPLQAADQSQLKLSLQKFRFPVDSSVIDRGVKFDVTIQVEGNNLALAADPSPIVIDKVKGEILGTGFPDHGTFSFEAQSAKGQKLAENQGEWQKLDGQVTLKKLKTQWSQVPAHLAATLLNIPEDRPFLQGLVGPEISGHLNFRENGEVEFDLTGAFGKHAFKGAVKNGTLELNAPLISEITFNPYLQALLHPSSLGGMIQNIDGPITVKVLPQGSSIPLYPFQLENIQIAEAIVTSGTLKIKNTGSMHALLEFLKEAAIDTASIQMTPIFLSLNKGILTIQRFDFLIQRDFPMAMWGNLDLMSEKLHLTLGLTTRALYNAIGLSLNLKEGNLVQIPIKGNFSKPVVDSRKATRKMTKMVVENQGLEGAVLSPLMDVFAGGGDQSEPAPAPTTNPLPWETTADVNSSPRLPSSPIQLPLEPVKKIGKGVGKLLKSIVD